MGILKAIILFCVFLLSVEAEPIDIKHVLQGKKAQFVKLPYRVQKNQERLSEIYKKFIKDDAVVSINHPMVQRTMNRNKVDFNNLLKKQVFDLYIAVDLIDFDKFSQFQTLLRKSDQMSQKKMESIKEQLNDSPFRTSIFYMASYGKFDQKNDDYADVSFLQNSPLSLGLSSSFYPKNKPYNISGSIYYSYLTTALIDSYTDDEVEVDSEIGGNLYFSYKLNSPAISLYGGFDYEKFNTFNLENLQKNGLVTFDTNQVTYLTVGGARSIDLFGQKLFAKLSYSHSILSQRKNSFMNAQNTETFTGSKILFYLFKNVGNKFFAHSLLKYHWMSGPSDITTLRLGIGFGYIL